LHRFMLLIVQHKGDFVNARMIRLRSRVFPCPFHTAKVQAQKEI